MKTKYLSRFAAAIALAAMPLTGFAMDPAGSTDNIVDNDTPVRLTSYIGKRSGVIIAQDDNTLASVSTSKVNGDSAVWLVFKNQELGRVFILNYATETFLGSDGSRAMLFDTPRSLRLFTATDNDARAMIIDSTNGGLIGLPEEFGGTNLIAETDSAKAIVTLSIGTSDSKITPDAARVQRLQQKCSTEAVTLSAMKVMSAFVNDSRSLSQQGMEAYVGVPKVDALDAAIKRGAPLDELEVLYDEAQASIYPLPGHFYRFINIARPDNGAATNVLSLTSDAKAFRCGKLDNPTVGATGSRAEDLSLFTVDSDPAAPSIVQISPAALDDMWLNNWGTTSVSTKNNAHNFRLDRRSESPYHFRMVRTDNGAYLTISGNPYSLVSYGIEEEPEWFLLKEIKEIPVNLDASGIASVALPCPVALPAGVQAYIALSATADAVEVMTLGSTIPAKTPVVLKGEPSAKIELTVLNGDYSLAVNNILTGTTVIPSNREERYVGANDDNGHLCFKRVRSSINANEAYIPASFIEGSKSMIPTDVNTGIEEVAAEAISSREGIYDLQGRRVASPAKGQVYIINGSKVLVK